MWLEENLGVLQMATILSSRIKIHKNYVNLPKYKDQDKLKTIFSKVVKMTMNLWKISLNSIITFVYLNKCGINW
jgi:hypothetical protein